MMDAKNGGGEAPSSTIGGQPAADALRNSFDAQSNAPSDSGAAPDAAHSKGTSKASSTRNSTPAAASLDVHEPAQTSSDASSAMEDVQHSLEATNIASNPVQSSSKESDQNGELPSSYGTRSRNRPGRSRPNYAEDTEMDFEVGAAPANGNLSDPPSRNSQAPDSGLPPGVSGKKGAGPAPSNASWGNSGANPKDTSTNLTTPGTTASPAPNPASTAQPTTKRRKNGAANATNGSHASAAPPSQPGAKRGTHPIVTTSARESNMLTFEKSGAFLKNGHLEADDGQTVNVNGKF